jgi:hypothetical protein
VDGQKGTTVDGQWHHVVIVDTTGVNASAMDIGRVSSSYFSGLIDDVRIYTRELSQAEITRLYKSGATVKIGISPANDSLGKGLVGWWTFDGKDMAGVAPAIEYALDKSGNGNRGTLTNGPTRVAGKIGQGLQFDGVDDYVNAGNASNLHMTQNTSMTFSAWIKVRNVHGDDFTILRYDDIDDADGDAPSTRNLYVFRVTIGFALQFFFGPSSGTSGPTSNSTLSLNQWYHVVAVRDVAADTASVYINGIADGTATDTTTGTWETTGQALYIGRFKNASSNEWFSGPIDDVRIYNRALNADEIKRLYNMGR